VVSSVDSTKQFRIVMEILRRPAYYESHSQRWDSLRLKEACDINTGLELLALLSEYLNFVQLDAEDMIDLEAAGGDDEDQGTDIDLETVVMMTLSIKVLRLIYKLAYRPAPGPVERVLHWINPKMINTFSPMQCWDLFGFQKNDLYRLATAFRLPPGRVVVSNRCVFHSEEILLIGLYRLRTNGAAHRTVCVTFDREFSQISRAWNFFVLHVLHHCEHFLTDNLEFWRPQFAYFAARIRRKLYEKGDVYIPQAHFHLIGFHDTTAVVTCRTGTGPDSLGNRKNPIIERQGYSGYYGAHGMKFQSFELPNGLCADLFGPTTIRSNDNDIMATSGLNERLAFVQAGQQFQYHSFGDSIYAEDTHVKSYYKNPVGNFQIAFDRGMKRIRISNEHAYEVTDQTCPFITDKHSFKLLQNLNGRYFYVIATLVRNARACLYGNIIGQFFHCAAPTLFQYFQVEAE
jgi:hypothetical protein